MEDTKERVLAYSMAKLIKHDDLAEVSGGNWNWCSRGTGGGSGGSGEGGEVHVDLVIDW